MNPLNIKLLSIVAFVATSVGAAQPPGDFVFWKVNKFSKVTDTQNHDFGTYLLGMNLKTADLSRAQVQLQTFLPGVETENPKECKIKLRIDLGEGNVFVSGRYKDDGSSSSRPDHKVEELKSFKIWGVSERVVSMDSDQFCSPALFSWAKFPIAVKFHIEGNDSKNPRTIGSDLSFNILVELKDKAAYLSGINFYLPKDIVLWATLADSSPLMKLSGIVKSTEVSLGMDFGKNYEKLNPGIDYQIWSEMPQTRIDEEMQLVTEAQGKVLLDQIN